MTRLLLLLLSLLAGVSRTAFAMAACRDLPAVFAAVSERQVPGRAVLAVGALVLAVALSGGLVGAVAASAFAVLVYYAITNAAALRLADAERRVPRIVPLLGLAACCLLAFSLPWQAVTASTMSEHPAAEHQEAQQRGR